MKLLLADASIRRLTDYLVLAHDMLPSLRQMRVEYSQYEDERNLENPRGCCHVQEGEWIIYCSQIIEEIEPTVRIGLLLHEVGHLYIPAMASEKSEIDVDAWILENIPEAGYSYLPEYRYHNSLWRKRVTAKNIQSVSSEFVFGTLA